MTPKENSKLDNSIKLIKSIFFIQWTVQVLWTYTVLMDFLNTSFAFNSYVWFYYLFVSKQLLMFVPFWFLLSPNHIGWFFIQGVNIFIFVTRFWLAILLVKTRQKKKSQRRVHVSIFYVVCRLYVRSYSYMYYGYIIKADSLFTSLDWIIGENWKSMVVARWTIANWKIMVRKVARFSSSPMPRALAYVFTEILLCWY